MLHHKTPYRAFRIISKTVREVAAPLGSDLEKSLSWAVNTKDDIFSAYPAKKEEEKEK